MIETTSASLDAQKKWGCVAQGVGAEQVEIENLCEGEDKDKSGVAAASNMLGNEGVKVEPPPPATTAASTTTTTLSENDHDTNSNNENVSALLQLPPVNCVAKSEPVFAEDQISSGNELDDDDDDAIPIFPMVQLEFGDGEGMLLQQDEDGDVYNQDEDVSGFEEEDGDMDEDLDDVEQVEDDDDAVNISNQWMGHQMMDDEEDEKSADADDWDVGDLIPPRRKPDSDSDESFAPSDEEESSDSGSDLASAPKRNQYSIPQLIRVYEPLLLPLTSSLPESTPWVVLKRMKPSSQLLLAAKRVKVEYKDNQGKGVGNIKCPQCGHRVSDKYLLQGHVEGVHPAAGEDSKFKCAHCGAKFKKAKQLRYHIRSLHPDKEPPPALVRGPQRKKVNLNATDSSKLERAMQKNQKDPLTGNTHKTFQCPHCPLRAKRESNFRIHLLTHARDGTGGKDIVGKTVGKTLHPCPICDKAYVLRSSLQRHVQIHQGHTDNTCPICGKTASRKHDMKRHMATVHPDFRPPPPPPAPPLQKVKGPENRTKPRPPENTCSVCGKSMSRLRDLKRHLANVHQLPIMD